MSTYQRSRSTVFRASILLIALSFVATACSALPFDLQPVATVDDSGPAPTPEPAPKDICTGLFDLGIAIEELRDADLVAVGVNGLLDQVNETLIEGQALAAAVGEVYRPLADDLNDSLIGLRDTLDALGDQATLGASIAAVGGAISDIGQAMDALSVQLQTSCEGRVRWEAAEEPSA